MTGGMQALQRVSCPAAVLCELGATAISASDGNLTSMVLACPPTACLGTACPGTFPRMPPVICNLSPCLLLTRATRGTPFWLQCDAFYFWKVPTVYAVWRYLKYLHNVEAQINWPQALSCCIHFRDASLTRQLLCLPRAVHVKALAL